MSKKDDNSVSAKNAQSDWGREFDERFPAPVFRDYTGTDYKTCAWCGRPVERPYHKHADNCKYLKLQQFIRQQITKAKREAVEEAVKILKEIKPYLEKSTDVPARTLEYITPAEGMRRAASSIEEKDAVIENLRDYLNKLGEQKNE